MIKSVGVILFLLFIVGGVSVIPDSSSQVPPPTDAFSQIKIDGSWHNATTWNDSLEFLTGGSSTTGASGNITASYIILTNGTFLEAINGNTGVTDYSGNDAATVFQNVVNALIDGGLVFVKEGLYNFTDVNNGSDLVLIENDGVYFQGEGIKTILRMTENGKLMSFVNVTGGGISDLQIEGGKGEGTQADFDENHGVEFVDSKFVHVKNVFVDGFGDEGIIFGRVNQSSITQSVFNYTSAGTGGSAINLQASNQILIALNQVINPALNGIHIEQTASTKANHFIIISQNTVLNAVSYGIFVSATNQVYNNTDILITQNIVENSGKENIRIAGSGISTPKNVVVSLNSVTGGGDHSAGDQRASIHVAQKLNPANTIAMGNVVLDYGVGSANRRGIQGFDIYDGNSVTGSGHVGLFVSSNSTVTGNIAVDNGKATNGIGIYLSGDNNLVTNNLAYNSHISNQYATRGIWVDGGFDNVVTANMLKNINFAPVDDDGTRSKIHHNSGYDAPNDWINSESCSSGDFISSYDNATGIFTCSSTSGGVLIGNMSIAVKKAHETIVNMNSATLVNDSDLFFPLAPNSRYEILSELKQVTNAAADFDHLMTYPIGTTGTCYEVAGGNGVNTIPITAEAFTTGNGNIRVVTLHCTVETGSSYGLLQVQWAQNTPHASDVVVREHSFLRAIYLGTS